MAVTRSRLETFLICVAGGALGALAMQLGVAGVPALAARHEAEVLRTKRLELRDDSGRLRALLGIDKHGRVELDMGDGSGQRRILLGVKADGSPVMVLADAHDTAVLGMTVTARRNGALDFFRKDGSLAASLITTADGSFHIGVPDRKGKLAHVWPKP